MKESNNKKLVHTQEVDPQQFAARTFSKAIPILKIKLLLVFFWSEEKPRPWAKKEVGRSANLKAKREPKKQRIQIAN